MARTNSYIPEMRIGTGCPSCSKAKPVMWYSVRGKWYPHNINYVRDGKGTIRCGRCRGVLETPERE